MLIDKPWGNFKQLTFNQNCSVKLITVFPGQETSLHFHNLRDDLWLVLDEGIEVQVGEEKKQTAPNDEFVIPSGKLHRIICTGDEPARVLEIAFGYTDEKDTIRTEDDYGRPVRIDRA